MGYASLTVLSGYFFGLNAIRMLSVVGLLLVFSSSIFVMVNDIRAVNHFSSVQGTEEGNLLAECDYIECVSVFPIVPFYKF